MKYTKKEYYEEKILTPSGNVKVLVKLKDKKINACYLHFTSFIRDVKILSFNGKKGLDNLEEFAIKLAAVVKNIKKEIRDKYNFDE